jgi:hypothetical protein
MQIPAACDEELDHTRVAPCGGAVEGCFTRRVRGGGFPAGVERDRRRFERPLFVVRFREQNVEAESPGPAVTVGGGPAKRRLPP